MLLRTVCNFRLKNKFLTMKEQYREADTAHKVGHDFLDQQLTSCVAKTYIISLQLLLYCKFPNGEYLFTK